MAPRKAKDAVPIAPAPAAVDHEDLMRKRDSVSYFSLFASCAFFHPQSVFQSRVDTPLLSGHASCH